MTIERVKRAGVRHIARVDPAMATVMRAVGPCLLQAGRPRFAALTRAIVGQQVSTSAARAVYERLRVAAGGTVAAKRVAALTHAELRSVGLSRQKAAYVGDLSTRVATRSLRLDRLTSRDDEAVISALTAVNGIGRWTAEMFLIFVLNRPDVLPVGDLGIQNGFVRVYGMRARPSSRKMEMLADSWRPYRTIGSWYLWRSLDSIG